MRREKGFTLIELMVVIVIIAILAAVALPNFMGATEKARESAVRSAVKTIQTAIEMYATEHSGTYTSNINAYTAYLPGNQFPKSPATNQPYVYGNNIFDATNVASMQTGNNADQPNEQYAITYSYDVTTNSYVLRGYNRTNTTVVLELSNK